MSEAKLSIWMRKQLKDCHVQRIETGINPGIPDLTICHQGVSVWVELKVDVVGKVILRKEQYAWGMARSNHLDRVFVVCDFVDYLLLWKFPHIEVVPWGMTNKYVQITSVRHAMIDKLHIEKLKSFLFTCT